MMRKSLVFVALCVATGLSAGAHAGNNNNAAVNQSGISNTATVDQTAASNANQALSNPIFNSGDNNTIDQQGNYDNATVIQAGTFNNGQIQQLNGTQYAAGDLDQSGTSLRGYIAQSGVTSSYGRVGQAGTGDYANIYQLNSSQVYAWILQGYTFGPATNDIANVQQVNTTGGRSFSWSFSDGLVVYGLLTGIFQGANVNDTAEVLQFNNVDSTGVIDQSNSSANLAAIQQTGAVDSFATVEQHGINNSGIANQYGTGEAHILQNGNYNQGFTIQYDGAPGAQNYAEIDQGNTLSPSNDNFAEITQNGFSNTALVTQNGNNNYASIVQAGVGNNATIHQ